MRWMTALALAGIASATSAQTFCLDFSTEDDFVTALSNGQIIDTEFGNLLTISGTGGAGVGIFDSTPGGVNASGSDKDLLVGLGNLLIVQNDAFSASSGGFFNTANDEEDGGSITFNFLSPTTLVSIDMVDINGGITASVSLFDGEGDSRVYSVPMQWTHDKEATPSSNGFATLDLTTLLPQVGERTSLATAVEDFGFDADGVVSMRVDFTGSAAIGGLKFVPTPASAALLGLAGLAATRRRRA